MCDQSSVQYNDGDVVWVKLGPCWWPGEVHDIKRVPPEIQPGLKKPPIAFVHFFQEDKYEYVRSLDYIYHYNCRRKHEFIKKGLDMHRAKQKHMDKFPVDVCTAETLTNGDPDIITSEEFAPQQKVNYANLFGSPANRKSTSKRNSLGGVSGGKPGRGRKSGTPRTLNTSTPARLINTQLNNKKYEVHDLTKRDEIPTVNCATNVVYNCDRCNYTCTRLNVITYHHQMHISEENSTMSPGRGKKKSKSKMSPQNKLSKIARCSTLTIDEDLELLKKGIDLSTYDYNKKKYKSPKIKFAKTLKLTEKKKITKKDVKGISNLLADWDDSGSEKEDEMVKSIDASLSVTDVSELQTTQTEEVSKDITAEKSCFDFEEDEEVATIISKSPGRKIPRVIPENQKAITPETVLDISNDLSFESESKSKEVDNADKISKGKRNKKSKVEFEEMSQEMPDNTETIEKQFDQIMAETALPEFTLLATVSTPLFSDTKAPDKKSRVRKKYELFSKDKSPVPSDHNKESDSETAIKLEKKVRGKKKSEIFKTGSTLEQESENDVVQNQEKNSFDKKILETNHRVLEHEVESVKRKSEGKNKIVENLSNEKIQESHKKKFENDDQVLEDIQSKNEPNHTTRGGKRKSEQIFKNKTLEDILQVTTPSKDEETKSVEVIEQKETRGRQKFETRGRKKSLSPTKEMKPAETSVMEQKELEQKLKKSKSDFKEKSPEMKLDKLFTEKSDHKVRGRKLTPILDKSDEGIVETNELSSSVIDLGKKTRNSKKFEPLQSESGSESFSEPTIASSKKLVTKRRGLSTVIPKDFKDIYNKIDSPQNIMRDNEQMEAKSEISVTETQLLDCVTAPSEENMQEEKETVQEIKIDSKADITPKRSKRYTKPETVQVEIKETSKEEMQIGIVQEETVEMKVDKRSKRHKTEKIDELKLDFNEECVETKVENKRSRRSQKLMDNVDNKTEIKVDLKDESIEIKSDNKRSRRSQKSFETLIEELKTESTDEKITDEKLKLKLAENVEVKLDSKQSKRQSNKFFENLEENLSELKVDTVDENKRSKRIQKSAENLESKSDEPKLDTMNDNKRFKKLHKLSENLEEKSDEFKIEIVDDNKRSKRTHKAAENLEEKPEELNIDTTVDDKYAKPEELKINIVEDNKRSRRSNKSVENLEEKFEELKGGVIDDNKRSRRLHKSSENLEDKAEELKIDFINENKRPRRSHKLTEIVDKKPEELKIDTVDENKRSIRLHKSTEIVQEKAEELNIEVFNEVKLDSKRPKRSQKPSETVVEEIKVDSIEEKIELKLDNKRSKKGSQKQLESEKMDQFKLELMDEQKSDIKRSKNLLKPVEVQEGTADIEKDKIESTSIEIIEPKTDKRSRKQRMEILKDDEPKTDDFHFTDPMNKLDDNLIEKTTVDTLRKSKRNKSDFTIVEKLNETEMKGTTSLAKSPKKEDNDVKRHKSPMKDALKNKKQDDVLDEEFVQDIKDEDLRKNECSYKDETNRPKLILSLKKDEVTKAKLTLSPKKDETDKGKLIHSPKEDETDKVNVILSPKKIEISDNEVIEKPKERLRILRKRGRFSYSSPTHSAKELLDNDDILHKSTADDSSNVSAYTFQETTSLTDSLLNIKKPSFSYREASAKAALANENKLKEQNEKQQTVGKSSTKIGKEKQDDSVKVMISLNDFKMEDIPLPPTPGQSISSSSSTSTSTSLKMSPKDKENQREEKVDTSPNTSQELKRTPIKFEISKMKAQINKKLITHKSFLSADDDDENSIFSRKIQPLHSESISLKRSNEKECEAPKKRVMADYKKELDMEKTKEREEQERKIQSENQFKEEEEMKVIEETTTSLDESKSMEECTALNLISEADIRKDDETIIDKTEESTALERENQDEKVTTVPLKHEDISAVINSGSEVKIIDPNSENITEDIDQTIHQIVHKPSIETTSAESIIKTLEGNETSTTPNQLDITSDQMNTTIDAIKVDENIKELQKVLESKDTNVTLFKELIKSDDHSQVPENQQLSTNQNETSTKLQLTLEHQNLDTSSKVVTTPDYVDELESIENEIQKITSSESSPCKTNIFPENIALISTPTKDNIVMNDSLIDNKDLYVSQLSESEQNTSLLLSTETTKSADNENSIESEIAKLTDTKPEENEIIPEQSFSTTSSKLLEILESKGDKTKVEKKLVPVTLADKKQTFVGLTAAQKRTVSLGSKFVPPKATKFVIKTSSMSKDNSNVTKKPKPIILSEEIIKPANNDLKSQPTKGVATKRNFEEDIEDKGGIKKFIIEKAVADSSTPSSNKASRIKPTVLSQTIITSTGKIIDGSLESNKESLDDNMFDINSMPIVLSDDLLTPESIENMPIVLSTEPEKSNTVQIMNKSGKVVPEKMKIIGQQQKPMIKSVMHQGIAKNQKVYQTTSTKLLSNKTAVITQPGKPEKFIILPSSSASQTTGSKYTVGKRQIRTPGQSSIVVSKSMTGVSTSGTVLDSKSKLQSGNKVMVVTNAQGQQSRIILSPAQQKMLGSKMGTKIVARGSPVTKGTTLSLNNIVTSKGAILTPTSTFVQTKTQTGSPQTVVTSKGQLLTSVHSQSIITSKGQILTPVTPTQMKALKGGVVQSAKKIQLHSQKIIIPANTAQTKPSLQSIPGVKTKTVLVKGQRHIVQKVQQNTSTPPGQMRTVVQKSPALKTVSTPTSTSPMITGKQKLTIAPKTQNIIKRQVIRQQGIPSQQPQRIILQKMSSDIKTQSTVQRPPQQKVVEQKSFIKSTRSMTSPAITSSQSVPPLVPLSPSQPKTTDSILSQNVNIETTPSNSSGDISVHSPKQLIIQDDMGNQTSITQGQILAVPGGEVIDGQPQSYMLVTVDESGNLLPLDNQALMALDPNLIGPDGNVMLQFNQGLSTSTSDTSTTLTPTSTDILASGTENTEIHKKPTDILSDATSQDYQQLLITDDQQNLIALGADQQLLMTDNQNLILTDQAVLQDPKVTLPTSDQAVTYSIANAEDGQQIFISGDPEKAQHLINALASGTQDLSQIMSNAEGNLIINADGQHIILNTDSAGTEQIILATSTDGFALSENYTPDFATQVTTNQDILAAALANTVFPQESAITEGLNIVTSATGGPLMSTTSELSPSLYQNMQLPNLPSGAVLETSLTNLAPIMSPLEVPTSGTSKKVPLDIETTSQVPKSLELPITITDPNIAQTVNSQLANELQTNLGLPITITDPNISNVRNSDLTTSTFGYSLPNIDDTVKSSGTSTAGPISMPLLTEDLESETTQLQKIESTKSKDNDIDQSSQPDELTNIFEPSKTNSRSNENQIEEIENSGNGLDVLASVTTASGMINVTESSNSELEHIFAEKKDDQQLPANVFAQNPSFDNDIDETKGTNSQNTMHHHHPHDDEDSFSRSQLTDHFVLGSPHSEIDANSDEISIQPSIVTEEGNNSNPSLSEHSTNSLKRGFDDLEDDDECDDNKKSKFDIS